MQSFLFFFRKGEFLLDEAAKQARREYQRKYREKNKTRLKEYHRKWRGENKEKIIAIQERYWTKKVRNSKTNKKE